MKYIHSVAFAFVLSATFLYALPERPVTARDCVETRYLLERDGETSLRINPQGTRLAYMVKSPNLRTNNNDVSLYIHALSGDARTSSKLIATTPDLSQIRWLGDGKHLAALSPVDGKIAVVLFDTDKGTREVLASSRKDIEEYTIDSAGNTVVFALREDGFNKLARTADERSEGYRVPNDGGSSLRFVWRSQWVPYELWIQRRRPNRTWTSPSVVPLHSPFSGLLLSTVGMAPKFDMSLSPDGRQLLLNIADIDMRTGKEVDGGPLPEEWLASPTFRRRRDGGGLVWITILQDLRSGRTSMPFKTPSAIDLPVWTHDGQAFYIVANAPVGSRLESDEDKTNPSAGRPWHAWRVDLTSSHIEEIEPDPNSGVPSILLADTNRICLRTGPRKITTLVRTPTAWSKESEQSVGPAEGFSEGQLASDGTNIVLDYQRSDIPPELRFYKTGLREPWNVTRLNPIFDSVEFAQARPIHWKTAEGVTVEGSLLLPSDYSDGKRYPLVIQTKPQQSDFVCDAGSSHFASFAPQPMATQGLLYLTLTGPSDIDRHYPTGYPGGIGEAVFFTDVWDSAVRELDRLGIVDPTKVGIIGYSRSGWYTEFALFRGRTHFAAATATDNVQYSLGGYWLIKSSLATISSDSMYGGPPFGDSLLNWMKYSITFNLDKIHTPLLLEAMGYGVEDETTGSTPINLVSRYELVTGLNRLKKPVELYYYPEEQHQPDHPRARLASLQRNIDWYRFWLQGYERPSPEDPDQYQRWRNLRELQQHDASASQ